MIKIIIFVRLNIFIMSIKGLISVYGRWISVAAAAVMIGSCSTFPEDDLYPDISHNDRNGSERYPDRNSEDSRNNVFIVYSMGYNNLSYDLNEDIDEMLSGYVPSFHMKDDAVLIFNHSTVRNSSNYKTKTSPVLYKAYRSGDGELIRDTLIVYPEGSVGASKEMFGKVLTYIKENFPAEHYGMLVSSHATGWAPRMYCYNPPDKSSSHYYGSQQKEFRPLEKYTDERPLTRSIGAHFNGSASNMDEIELQDFADAIPFHLDYLLFDCCFMGGVEVAYQLKDKCDRICFSQTEILSGGMDYKYLLSHLLEGETPDLGAIALDYYNMYANEASENLRSATVSVVDCRKTEKLASIIARYADDIYYLGKSYTRNSVQRYFQSRYSEEHGIFFDLEHILVKSFATEEDLAELRKALDECIECKYATERFLTNLEIQHHSGLSMYLPDIEREILNDYYKTLEWNKATGIIPDKE